LEYGKCFWENISPTELYEEDEAKDEMFWMILGDEDYANADYWKWRNTSSVIDLLIWRIESERGNGHVSFIFIYQPPILCH